MAKKAIKKKTAPVKKKKPVKRQPKVVLLDVSNIEPKDYLKVEQIEDSTESLTVALGISEERACELSKLADSAFHETTKMSAAMVIVSQGAKHANELAYMTYVLAEIRNRHSSPLMAILSMGMKRPGGPEQG